jgi:23S rRNA pseudouridine1911/1915/1917 synthase
MTITMSLSAFVFGSKFAAMTLPSEDADGLVERLSLDACTADAGQRLDRLIAAGATGLSRSRAKALIEEGRVRCGARTIMDPSYRVKPGERFEIVVPAATDAVPQGQSIPLSVVYEDAHLIVIDKPAGLVVHPAPGNPDRTLVNALIAHCGASLSGIGGVRRPGIVHRLDKDTSGLMVAAKTDAAHRGLAEAFARHDIDRAYRALVWGVPSPREGRIEGPIGRHPIDRKRMTVRKAGGKPALTRYRVLRAFGTAASLVQCRLATGRTHQIRVHMASIGHPVIGDPVYGRTARKRRERLPESARSGVEKFGRQALHAARLGFMHPITGESMAWEAADPLDFSTLALNLESV